MTDQPVSPDPRTDSTPRRGVEYVAQLAETLHEDTFAAGYEAAMRHSLAARQSVPAPSHDDDPTECAYECPFTEEAHASDERIGHAFERRSASHDDDLASALPRIEAALDEAVRAGSLGPLDRYHALVALRSLPAVSTEPEADR